MPDNPTVAILGGGNGAFCHAADLAIKGFRVNLCEVPEMAQNLQGAKEQGGIHVKLFGDPGVPDGFGRVAKVTTDAKEALADAEVVMVVVPAFAQRRFAEFCAPYLRSDQLVMLSPGNFGGCLDFWRILKRSGSQAPLLCETECMTYSGFKSGPAEVEVAGYKTGHGVAAFPGTRTDEAVERLRPFFPTIKGMNTVLETGLRNVNAMHPPMMVLNAGRIEYYHGGFRLYWDGVTEGVGNAVERVEAERMAIGSALGISLTPMHEVLVEWYGHSGAQGNSLAQVMRTNPVYKLDMAPTNLGHRFLTEDIPYGMVPMERMGRFVGVPTPVTTAFIELTSAMLCEDLRKRGRDLDSLGLAQLSVAELKDFFYRGPEELRA